MWLGIHCSVAYKGYDQGCQNVPAILVTIFTEIQKKEKLYEKRYCQGSDVVSCYKLPNYFVTTLATTAAFLIFQRKMKKCLKIIQKSTSEETLRDQVRQRV